MILLTDIVCKVEAMVHGVCILEREWTLLEQQKQDILPYDIGYIQILVKYILYPASLIQQL